MFEIEPKNIAPNALEFAFELKKYTRILRAVQTEHFTEDPQFRRDYIGYYRVRYKSREWYSKYFSILGAQKEKNYSLNEILWLLYNVGGKVDASFASKIIATIDPTKPIWDKYVLNNLNYRQRWEKGNNAKIDRRIEEATIIYCNIIDWYDDFLTSAKGIDCINYFDNLLPDYKNVLSDVKKIDYILWSTR